MRIFITGATGYIGEQLALALRELQYEVVALVRSPDKASALVAAGVNLVKGDLDNTEALEAGMRNCDAVLHLAAYARAWPEDAALFKKYNVEGTRNVLEAAFRNNIKKTVVTSTASVFGPSPAPGAAVDEETPRTFPFFSLYEASKAEADALARTYAAKGLPVIILHPARVYGPGRESESNAMSKLLGLYLKGKWRFLPGDGNGMGSYCYIGDVVKAYINAIQLGRSGESYLLGGENVSYKAFFEVVQRITGKNQKLYPIPAPLLMLLSRFLVAIARLTGSRPLITPAWTKKYMYDWIVSSQKATGELQYKITPLEEGLKKTIDYIGMKVEKNYTLITGASAGIGKAIAEECAKRKQHLLLVALPDTGLKEVAAAFRERYHITVKTFELNLLEPQASQRLYDSCNSQGLSVNVLINNAGTGNYSSFSATPLDKYLDIIKLNSEVVVAITKLFLPKLKEHSESYILNVGSFVSFLPIPYKSVYSATKSFVLTFSRALQSELRQFGIHVSCLCPGPTLTDTVKERNSHLIAQSSDLLTLSPESVAKAAVKGLFNKKGVIIPGWQNRVMLSLIGFIPFRLKSYILNAIFKDKIQQEEEVVVQEQPIKARPVLGIDGQQQQVPVPGLNYNDKQSV